MAERATITARTEDPRVELLLTLADDELIMGHRLSEWTGWVPYLEGDLAFSSIAQDEIGHARALYRIAVQLGAGQDEDALALGRPYKDYRHARICSRPNGDFATSLARQWCYDRADRIRLDAIREGSFKELTELCAVIELEETFHRAHANAWFERLVDGPITARHRFVDALTEQLKLMPGFFGAYMNETSLLSDGVITRPSAESWDVFRDEVLPILDEAGIDESHFETPTEVLPTSAGAAEVSANVGNGALLDPVAAEGRGGASDEDFEALWTEMTSLYRAEAEARW